MVGGGALAVVLGLGGTAAGASATSDPPTSQAQHGTPPTGIGRPTTAGKVTALSDDTITIEAMGDTAETVTYASTTTFRNMSGIMISAALKVGDFIAVRDTKSSDGDVTAATIMISTAPPRRMGQGGRGRTGGAPPQHSGAPTS